MVWPEGNASSRKALKKLLRDSSDSGRGTRKRCLSRTLVAATETSASRPARRGGCARFPPLSSLSPSGEAAIDRRARRPCSERVMGLDVFVQLGELLERHLSPVVDVGGGGVHEPLDEMRVEIVDQEV